MRQVVFKTAIGALVREADQAESKPDFIHKMAIDLKEANETEYWLELLYETKYRDPPAFASIHPDVAEVLKLLTSIVRKAKTNFVELAENSSSHFGKRLLSKISMLDYLKIPSTDQSTGNRLSIDALRGQMRKFNMKSLSEIHSFPEALRDTLETQYGIVSAEAFYEHAVRNSAGIGKALKVSQSELTQLKGTVEGYLTPAFVAQCGKSVTKHKRGVIVE